MLDLLSRFALGVGGVGVLDEFAAQRDDDAGRTQPFGFQNVMQVQRLLAVLLHQAVGAMPPVKTDQKVHFVLDEAASLGHMEALDDAVDKFRGYGVRLQFYYQSIGQLQKCWPDGGATTLLSNTTQVFFGVNDPQTAGYVSSRLGEETILVESGGASSSTTRQSSQQGSGNSSYSTSIGNNWQQIARKLLKPEEVEALDPRVAITFTPSAPLIWTWLIRYYETDFGRPQGLGPVKAAFDAACLFLAASLLAVWWTAALFYHTFP